MRNLLLAAALSTILPIPAATQPFQHRGLYSNDNRRESVGLTIPFGRGGSRAELQPRVAMIFGTAATLAASEVTKLDEIRLSLFDHRRTPNLYWRIDSSGKGEIRTPHGTGYEVAAPIIVDSVFVIAPGKHRFDIGQAGYQELRAHLGLFFESQPDRFKMSNSSCVINTDMRSGTVELSWSGMTHGEISLPSDCLNDAEQYFHDYMVRAWHILARIMHTSGDPSVALKKLPTMPIPDTLNFSMTNAWTGAPTGWSIDKTGKGWIEVSKDGSLRTLDFSKSSYAKAGRRYFQIDQSFHQGVLRELDPYLSDANRHASCKGEMQASDQPIVRLEWRDQANRLASFVGTLGCPSVAGRFEKVEQAFAQLMATGQLGESRILSSN